MSPYIYPYDSELDPLSRSRHPPNPEPPDLIETHISTHTQADKTSVILILFPSILLILNTGSPVALAALISLEEKSASQKQAY